MIAKYPTKEEILAYKYTPDKRTVRILEDWKKESWKEAKDKDIRFKRMSLARLIEELNLSYDNVETAHVDVTDLPTCFYKPDTRTIYLDNSGSIISALHEYGHHLFGGEELMACVFSVNLFKEVFPKAYAKLRWEGHMLKKV